MTSHEYVAFTISWLNVSHILKMYFLFESLVNRNVLFV